MCQMIGSDPLGSSPHAVKQSTMSTPSSRLVPSPYQASQMLRSGGESGGKRDSVASAVRFVNAGSIATAGCFYCCVID